MCALISLKYFREISYTVIYLLILHKFPQGCVICTHFVKFSAQLFVYDTRCHTEGGVCSFFLQLSLSLSLLLLLLSLLSLKCRRKRRRPTSVPPQVASVSVPVSHKSKHHPGLLHVFMCLSLCDTSNFDFNIGDTFYFHFLWNLLIGRGLGAAQKQTPPWSAPCVHVSLSLWYF